MFHTDLTLPAGAAAGFLSVTSGWECLTCERSLAPYQPTGSSQTWDLPGPGERENNFRHRQNLMILNEQLLADYESELCLDAWIFFEPNVPRNILMNMTCRFIQSWKHLLASFGSIILLLHCEGKQNTIWYTLGLFLPTLLQGFTLWFSKNGPVYFAMYHAVGFLQLLMTKCDQCGLYKLAANFHSHKHHHRSGWCGGAVAVLWTCRRLLGDLANSPHHYDRAPPWPVPGVCTPHAQSLTEKIYS